VTEIKIGLIGAGHLGQIHARLLKGLEQVSLSGFYDIDPDKSRKFSSESGLTGFPGEAELLTSCQAVLIATPTASHFDIARRALSAGKHVFVEKPLTATPAEAEELIALAEKERLILQVGHVERYNPAFLALSALTLNPVFIEAHRLASFKPRGTDVAVILDLMIHDLDLILHLVGSPWRSVEASGVNVVSRYADIANARIEFENGAVANITASRISARKMRKMRLFQKGAYISMDFDSGESEVFFIPEDQPGFSLNASPAISLGPIETADQPRHIRYSRLTSPGVNPISLELACFRDVILGRHENYVSGRDGLQALRLAFEILDKINTHQTRMESAQL